MSEESLFAEHIYKVSARIQFKILRIRRRVDPSVEQERTKVSGKGGGLLKSNSRHSIGKCRSSSAAFVLSIGGKMEGVIRSRHRVAGYEQLNAFQG
ncbi:hypothetical protein CDAR_611621 [Caerostris darwini]|uniref:Uncharacterized protein n=1 Tax=Caerostris darwini TaxID=1538125 RepID=A0AAV4U2Q2_9ARAC|nr:hypothetical protein CDAR_611621 [Caerostris darwini]